MKFWWLSSFRRVSAEKTAVERLAAEEKWFTLSRWCVNGHRLSAEGEIRAHGASYPVRLIYPDQFPSVPAWVEPQDPEAQWSSHQYGRGGPLCLELRPDNWSPLGSGADVLRSAYNLLLSENPYGDGDHGRVSSAHRIGDAQSYDWGHDPILVSSACLERIRCGTAEDLRALRWMAADNVWPIVISDASDRASEWRPPASDIYTWRFEIPVLVARAEPPEPTPADRAGLGRALGLGLGPEMTGGLIIIAVGVERTTPYHSMDEASVFARKWVVLADRSGLRSGRSDAALGKSVAVIGTGSVGSKVAEMLLRSGVERMVLVDGDVFLPGNLERHILDWRDVGFRKAHAVRRRLLQIAPGARIDAVADNLNWQRSARTHAHQVEVVAACDLIVNATGDLPTSLFLGAIAAENGRPFVSVEAFEGGLGASIARSIPGRDPAYVDGRAAYGAWCDQMNVQPPASGQGTYEALSDGGDPLVADDASVSIAAAHAARVVLDVLDEKVGSKDTAWLLVGCRAGWLFDGHGHVVSLDVASSPPAAEPADDEDARAFVLALLEGALGAASPSS